MTLRYAEDYRPGEAFDLGSHRITEAEIVEFARQYDPQPMHVDKEFAARSHYGGLISSGWLTALILFRLMLRGFICQETSLGSPGHDETRWFKPVRPGDVLHGRAEVGEVRISKSKPEMGFVHNTATLTNQAGQMVLRIRSTAIFKTRPAANKK
jgi:acyl dehydratase